jgi:uncharacterized protein (DUF1330 family)
MAAYVIVNIDVRDPERYEEYKRRAAATVEEHGGRYLARGGRAVRREGDWEPRRIVILEFPSFDAAEGWYDSDSYAPVREIRFQTASADFVIVEGVEEDS